MNREQQAETERWFVRRGFPHAIANYSATDDVFTRAAPFLGFVLFVEIFASFDDRLSGWAQAGAFIAGVAIVAGALIGVNRLRGRRPLQLPDHIGVLELGVFLVVPALLPLLFSDERGVRFTSLIVVNLVVLGVAYTVTSYGLVPALRVGLSQILRQFTQVLQLMARSLPLLLVFSVFVFLNAEMWQVAQDFHPAYYAVVVPGLVLLALGFVILRLPQEIDGINQFESWDQVAECADRADAPEGLALHSTRTGGLSQRALTRVERINLGLLLLVGQLVQVLLIGAIIGLFYVGFGLLAVRETTIEQWTTNSISPIGDPIPILGEDVLLTWELLAVAGFIAAFSMLQFAVSSTTDSAMRQEFTQQAVDEVRQVLAVRALYNDQLELDSANNSG